MAVLLLLLLIATLIVGPQLWIRWIFLRYSAELPDIPGTGAELARHLLQRFEIQGVVVEETDPQRDHFDASTPAIRLSPRNYHDRSLTAIAVATHELGHAIQWHRKEAVFRLRQRYIPLALKFQRAGILMLSLSPVFGLLTRSPTGVLLPVVGGVLAALCGAATYLIVLPEEWDASFNKAMPILVDGDYIGEQQHHAVKSILRAAALTYAAGALASLLQVWRWLPLLLRR
ncbi:zinc metallopeptidase [Granulosicoccus sp. 3-233]|uniref:zinc metallopeptidase n=1 Tax=Granulosicoccus sp. 3-233 TaxID=3417969 RepID=UPI003D33B6E4